MKMDRYNADATRIVNNDGEVEAMILTMANGTFRLYDRNEKPLNRVSYKTRKEAFAAYVISLN